ncbi:cysteine--tRNA ligase [Patescibacteria group bacterium]
MLKVYSTLSRQKEEFKPLNDKEVTFYLCGPTVYDAAHLGHGRSATAFDIIRRYLLYKGFNLKYVSNYTDIDDKMINRANEECISVKELSEKVIPKYVEDYNELLIMDPDIKPKATEYIDHIIKIIKKLDEKDSIYELEDGVYFDITKFPEYGKLSGQNLEELQMGARVAVNEAKRNPQDFALWKLEKPGEPSWDSPWGKGRPGWHIECSAMSAAILGESIDFHAGGADLTFPHHECEVAQSETAHGKQFAKYWLHNGFININEEKMSKSLGNFITLRDMLDKYSGPVIRYLYLQTHYRAPINFTDALLEQSKQSLQRIHDFVAMVKRINNPGEAHDEVKDLIEKAINKFETAMDDDFETPNAIASLFVFITSINNLTTKYTTEDRDIIIDYLNKINEVFQVIFPEDFEISHSLKQIIKDREEARKNKDWAKSDELRDLLKEKGVIIEDTPEGTIWKKA